MISESTISKVRELSIEDVLRPYVKLSRKGSALMGLCPFHEERTGSFSVSPAKNLFHCFSCNRGGDAITFIMEKEGFSFMDAVRFIAKHHNIQIEYTQEEYNEEQMAEEKHRESLLVALDHIQAYFLNCLRTTDNIECKQARDYAYGRWPEEFCSVAGIGYAPIDGNLFVDYCQKRSLNEEALFELGMLKRGEDGHIYAMFRQRIMIPIRNRWGRIIAYTARHIGHNPKAPKYINSSTSPVYSKGETLFGIDRASRQRNADYFIIVEGAPDVLRMQSVGFDNTVAALGTAWTDSQFEQLKKYTSSLCFIPDSDVTEGKPYGAGFEAVMANGAMAIRKGFHVTVRELPFVKASVVGENIPSEDTFQVKFVKNDADSFIKSKEDYTSLAEKHFIIWLAQKRFLVASSLVEERKCVAEIADLMRYVKDQLVFDQCIEQLAKLHGKVKLWRDAVAQARGEARKRNERLAPMNEMQRDAELLRQFGLFVRENCYYATGDDDEEPARISNFIMEPLFHIEDESNGTRIFRMRNMYNMCRVIELKESELCSLSNFQQKVGSLGNYVWLAKIDKLNRVKEYLYSKTDTAERIRKLGWNDTEGFFAFGNGILMDGTFREVDELGIVRGINSKAFYIPATSKIYIHNQEIFQFERLMVHENRNGVKLYDYVTRLVEVFGENAAIAFSYLLSTLFRDIIFRRTRHFPILNLFGEKGTGKTTLATSLQSFFLHGVDPPNLGVTSVPAMNDRVSQAVNTLVVLDEYKNDLDIRKIAYPSVANQSLLTSQRHGNQLAVQQDIHSALSIAGHKVRLTSVLGAVIRSVFAGVHIVSAIGINIKLAALVTNLGESLNLGNIHSTRINVLQVQCGSTGLGELQIEISLVCLGVITVVGSVCSRGITYSVVSNITSAGGFVERSLVSFHRKAFSIRGVRHQLFAASGIAGITSNRCRESGGAQCQSHDHGQHSCNDLLHVCFLHKNLFVSDLTSPLSPAVYNVNIIML